jgi:DNA-binding beta-propeller fold protein YncE
MISKKLMIAVATLVLFVGSMAASQEYRVVKIWPEIPLGWHFFKPNGVAVDKSGNVYIGDSGNFRVKKYDPDGRFISEWGSPGQKDGQFNTIGSVRVGPAGIVYVVDADWDKWKNGRIQEFTPEGQFIRRFERRIPDPNESRLPYDLAFDRQGNILVLAVEFRIKEHKTYEVRIEKYSPAGKFLSQWGTKGGHGDGQLERPDAIAVDAEGNVYIVERGNGRVQKFDSSGRFLTKWGILWLGGDEGEGIFRGGARSIAIDKRGYIYVLDFNSVQKFTQAGKFLARWKTKGEQACRLAVDSRSNVYVTNKNMHIVTKFDSSGNVLSQWGCAGTGDGLFNQPGSIAMSPLNDVIVSDIWNYRIQSFDSEGRFVSKWGGETEPAAWNLATDASGNLYVACGDGNEIQKFDPDGRLLCRWGSSGRGEGQFQTVSSIAVGSSGQVYVADGGNNRVQKFTNDGKFLAKWGTKGTGDGQFNGPFFIAVDDSGNVWVGDQLGSATHRMQKFDRNGKFLMTWTREITRPPFTNYMGAVAVDSVGNSYYAFENRIDKYDPEGNPVSDYGPKESSQDELGQVWAMCVDRAGCLYITGPAAPQSFSPNTSGSIRKFDADGKLIAKWTAENTEEKRRYPNGAITVDHAGNIYASSWDSPSIQRLSSHGTALAEFQIAAPREGRFTELGGVTVDRSGRVYAVDSLDLDWWYGVPSIKQFDPDGQIIRTWDVAKLSEGKIRYPARIAVDDSGNMYVTDQSSHCVHKLDAQGNYIKSWGSKGTGDGQFDTPEGIAVDAAGHVYVCDRQNCRIEKFDSDGKFLAKWGKAGSGDGEFHFPAAVAVDKDGNVFVADSDNHRVEKFTAEGKFLTKWGRFGEGPGQFNVPLGIAVDAAGNVYVSDSHNQRIQKFALVPARRE